MREIDSAHLRSVKMQNFHIFASIKNTHFPESGTEKPFQASGMRAIDSLHEITPRNINFEGEIL